MYYDFPMRAIQPIMLKIVSKNNDYLIKINNADKFISTPSGNLILSRDKELIELIIVELQKFYELEIDKKNSILGEPVERVSLYSLLSTEIDFWRDTSKKFPLSEMEKKINIDPITNLSPGPEMSDQVHQWQDIIKLLNDKGYDFYKIQYFGEKKIIKNLAKEILYDFSNAQPFQKTIFIQLTHIFDSIISSWAFVFGNIPHSKFPVIFTETAAFQKIIDLAPIEKKLGEDGKYSDGAYPIELMGKVIKEETKEEIEKKSLKKIEVFKELEEIFLICEKFKQINSKEILFFLNLIENGESKKVEFKETLSLDIKNQTKEKWIEESILKTIAGYLNSEGGHLFIGIDDNGTSIGIKNEISKLFKSKDKILLHLKNLIKHKIGETVFPLISFRIIEIHNNDILYVNCKKSDREILIGNDFYIRSGPSTDKIEGKQMIDYIRKNFTN